MKRVSISAKNDLAPRPETRDIALRPNTNALA
jgi:hypothetical protein